MKVNLRQRLLTILFLLAVIVGFDWLMEATGFLKGNSRIRGALAFLGYTLLLFLTAVNATYRLLFDFRSGMAKITAILVTFLVLSMFLADRMLAVSRLWNYAVDIKRRTDPFLFQDDPHLGYRAVPNAKGNYEYFIGDSIHQKVPVIFDSQGLRVATLPPPPGDSLDLYLGCSFTFGDYITAEQSYPYKTSKRLGHSPVNAALSGYGLAQMKRLADTIIPRGRFRYVFIQLSYWLTDRAVTPNRTTLYGYKAVPYFSKGQAGFELNDPVYKSSFRKKAREWHEGERTYARKLLFSATDGFTIEFVDYTRYLVAKAGMRLGVVPRPAKDMRALEKEFYDHVIGLARKNGSIPVIVKISYSDDLSPSLLEHLKGQALLADVDKAAADSCRISGTTFREKYQLHHPHPAGPIHFDNHPNPVMTDLISDVILSVVSAPSK
jgi:hypothetical protein